MHRATGHHPRSAVRRVVSRFGAFAVVATLALTPRFGIAQLQPDSSAIVTARDGARLHVAIYGSGRDTVIVPGGMLLAQHLQPLTESATLVFYDPRGRGQSEWIADSKRLTMGHEITDLEAVRSALGISRAALIGFSYLGLVTALYTADHPANVTRLALLDPIAPDEATSSRYAPAERSVRSDSARVRLARARAAASDTLDPAAECRRWYAAYAPLYVGDTASAQRLTTELCAYENEAPSRVQWRMDQTMRSLPRRWDYSAKAAAIRVPTLVIQGDHDLVASPDGARRWAELIPNARLFMLAGAGHSAYIERRERVIPGLVRFIEGDWPPEAMQVRSR